MKPEPPPKFIAVLEEVREVSLTGLADAASWGPLLRSVDLQLARKRGKAEVVLTAVEARYLGIRFRELSLALAVRHPQRGETEDCLLLAYAFHSSRAFALVERSCFHTPYYPARIEVDTQLPVSFNASRRDGLLLSARMADGGSATREPVRCGHDGWEGPIFLPRKGGRDHRNRRWFAARLAGDTHVYPFIPAADELVIKPSPRCPILQVLADSAFTGKEWIIRQSAIHARSKTYRQAEVVHIAKVEAPALESPV